MNSTTMLINLTYIFFILIGMYFGIVTYIETKKREVFPVLVIFILSLALEFVRLDDASYKLDLNDFLRTSRDIVRTVITIMFFQGMRKCLPNIKKKTRTTKKSKKK